MRSRSRGALLAGGAILAIAGGLIAAPDLPAPAQAAPAEFRENFDGAPSAERAPGDWTVEQHNTAGMQPGWEGWSFHSTDEVIAKWDATGDRSAFRKAQGLVAVVHSDQNKPASGDFDSTLWSPRVPLSSGAQAVELGFDSHYKQGQAPQNARLVVRFDGAEAQEVQNFDAKRLDTAEKFTVDVPAGAKDVQFGWSYLESSNNWFWMIDNVRIIETEQAQTSPQLDGASKPVATAGATVPIPLRGLRPGQRLTAVIGAGGAASTVTLPAADANGHATLTVRIAANQASGVLPVVVSGPGAAPLAFGLTVLASADGAYSSTEEQLWHSGFEGADSATWSSKGDTSWEFLTRKASLDAYGTDRRHAFTRASGTMAVAEAAKSAFEGTLRSAAIPVERAAGDAVELRFDSHILKRGNGAATAKVTAVTDDGSRTTLGSFGAEDRESEQLRLKYTIPSEAKTVRFEFAFAAPAGAGSWRIDDVELVRPLAPLADSAQPSAVIDVFSDVQGSTSRLKNQVIPGLRALSPAAKTIVSNGDLTPNGTELQYTGYFNAYNAAVGDQYSTKISTIGNHEFFGGDGSETYITRFLDRTNMRGLGAEGADPAHAGLWGETLVDGQLPVLWIGSEFHNFPAQTGSGPFVDMSDQQFAWLQSRLAHWKAANTPVLLFSHHVFNDSVLGTYARFYQGDYASDTARIEGLLAQNPNVTVLTSHTHWAPQLDDWSVEQRFDPAAKHGPTIVNTAAVTTQYGPLGDWEEQQVPGADPVGLRVGLFEDRLRVTAYSFGAGGTAKEVKHIDVPRPKAGPVKPEPQPEAKITLGAKTVVQGGELAVSGSGFSAGEKLTISLDGETSAPRADATASAATTAKAAQPAVASRVGELVPTPALGDVTADAKGAFSARVRIPAETTTGAHTLTVQRVDGAALSAPLEVRAASEKPGNGSGKDPVTPPTTGPGATPAPGSGSGSGSNEHGAKGGLAKTGGESLIVWGGLAALSAAVGGTLMVRRRTA